MVGLGSGIKLDYLVGIHITSQSRIVSVNLINGDFGCENQYKPQDVLKKERGFKSFVISDWGGTHSMEKASTAGLDQEQPMADFFGPKLKAAVEAGQVPMSEIDDHARRVLYAEFLSGGCRRT
jgi:beta-glucosidase